MRPRHLIAVAIGCLLLTAGAASAAVGNPSLARYFVSDPVGGSPVPKASLQALVTGVQRAVRSADPGAVVAAQGWSNARVRTGFIEAAAALSGKVPDPGSEARGMVTSVCRVAGGSPVAVRSIAAVPNAYEAACPVRPSGKFEVALFVKMNGLVIFLGVTGPAFPLASLDTLAQRQFGLIPGSGIPKTTAA